MTYEGLPGATASSIILRLVSYGLTAPEYQEQKEGNMEVTIYKPDFTERYGRRLTPSTVLEYVKQEYPVDENLTERDIEIHDEGDYARVIIESD